MPSNAEGDEFPFAEHSPEFTAHIRDELDELATSMCSSLFQQYKQTPARVYDEVMQAVKDELSDGRGSTLDPGDSCLVAMKVQDTIQLAIKYLQLSHKMDMLTMCTITHAVINRSQEENMDQEYGKHLLGWGQGWTWGHHARLVEARNGLINPSRYSVESPVDLMRMLGNADRHLNSHFKGVTPLRALLDEFPLIHCLTASLLPSLDSNQLGVDEEQRALAKKHLEGNPEWREFSSLLSCRPGHTHVKPACYQKN